MPAGHPSKTSPPGLEPGARVRVRGRTWTVVRLTTCADCEALRLAAATDRAAQRTLLLPFDRPRRLDDRRLDVVSARAWLHAFKRLLAGVYPYGGLRQRPQRIDILPYQLEPAIALLRDGYPRLLIADAVGLGKTIEAGIVLRELSDRHEGFRALVLVPAGLRTQWEDELAARFGIDAVAADAAWLRGMARALPPDVNPWSMPGTYVASFDFVKRPEALRALEDVRWDLLVLDEAHAAAAATDRRAAVDAVARRAHRVILLTATPPSEPAELEALCRIGAARGDPDVVMFSRGRASQGARARRSVVLPVTLTAGERRMHRLLERYTALVWREARGSGHAPGRLAATLLRKRALSSAGALAISIRRRLDLLDAGAVPSELQLLLPLNDDEREDLVNDSLLAAPGLRSAATERRWLGAVLAAADAASGTESKLRVLVALLRRIREPAIVFTEYRDTLERLRTLLLAAAMPTCVVHGGLTPAERRDALAGFGRGGMTLLATDAAAEGLNLQRTCRVVVHFELPWNPARMLQRAGRVDRIGQRRRVHEIALVACDTAEALVVSPIARRIMPVDDRGGRRMLELLTESRVADAIFEGRAPDAVPHAAPAPPALTLPLAADSIVEALRLQRLRTVVRDTAAATDACLAIAVSTLRRSRLPPGVVLVFDVEVIEPGANDVVQRDVSAIHVPVAGAVWPRRRAHLKACVADALPLLVAAARPVVDELGARRVNAVRNRFAAAASRIAARERRVCDAAGSAARQLVQAGLFDRPWITAAAARRDAGARLSVPPERHEALSARTPDLITAAKLRALLVVSRR